MEEKIKYFAKQSPYLTEKTFILSKAKEALDNWETSQFNVQLVDEILENGQIGYKHLCEKYKSNDESAIDIYDKLNKLVAYCYSKAKNKNELNEYHDKRVIAPFIGCFLLCT